MRKALFASVRSSHITISPPRLPPLPRNRRAIIRNKVVHRQRFRTRFKDDPGVSASSVEQLQDQLETAATFGDLVKHVIVECSDFQDDDAALDYLRGALRSAPAAAFRYWCVNLRDGRVRRPSGPPFWLVARVPRFGLGSWNAASLHRDRRLPNNAPLARPAAERIVWPL